MRKRINLLALLVIAAGGAVFARPEPANATYYNPWTGGQSCCSATNVFGRVVVQCCSPMGCSINTQGRCAPLS
ncbi:MAG TPA: hypothetical protein VFS20_32040 [Longimicrobium sp.]|nr:hypothetical protein [Longimicrobium sp.]